MTETLRRKCHKTSIDNNDCLDNMIKISLIKFIVTFNRRDRDIINATGQNGAFTDLTLATTNGKYVAIVQFSCHSCLL